MIKTLRRTTAALLLAASALATPAIADTDGTPTSATIHADTPGPVYDKRIFTQFAEHLGTGIYGGLWVGKDRSIPNTNGFRNDVVAALRNLSVPVRFCCMTEHADGLHPDVEVIDLPQVGPYEPELVSSEDPGALIVWLNDNGYVITPEMYPFVAQYVASGMVFLGIQLAPEPQSGVFSIKPLNLTYHGTTPMVPLTLSAVSAEPEMGFVVFIAGEDNYEADNYLSLDVDTDLLHADPRTGEIIGSVQASDHHPIHREAPKFEEQETIDVVFETGNNADRLGKLTARGGKGVGDEFLELGDVEGFEHVIVRAVFHRGDGGLGGAKSGH